MRRKRRRAGWRLAGVKGLLDPAGTVMAGNPVTEARMPLRSA
jgi:hypothetical protein